MSIASEYDDLIAAEHRAKYGILYEFDQEKWVDTPNSSIAFKRVGKRTVVLKRKIGTVDYSIELERAVLRQIATLPPNLQTHFQQLSPEFNTNPLVLSTNKIEGDQLFEYMHRMTTEKSHEKVLNLGGQAMCAMELARQQLGITHNDLHPKNIIVVNTLAKYHVYKIGNKNFVFKTFGLMPVIFDFGHARFEPHAMKGSLWAADYGLSHMVPDTVADTRRIATGTRFLFTNDIKPRARHTDDPRVATFVLAVHDMFLQDSWFIDMLGSIKKSVNLPDISKELARDLDINLEILELFIGNIKFPFTMRPMSQPEKPGELKRLLKRADEALELIDVKTRLDSQNMSANDKRIIELLEPRVVKLSIESYIALQNVYARSHHTKLAVPDIIEQLFPWAVNVDVSSLTDPVVVFEKAI